MYETTEWISMKLGIRAYRKKLSDKYKPKGRSDESVEQFETLQQAMSLIHHDDDDDDDC
jgi:hypothetical protein